MKYLVDLDEKTVLIYHTTAEEDTDKFRTLFTFYKKQGYLVSMINSDTIIKELKDNPYVNYPSYPATPFTYTTNTYTTNTSATGGIQTNINTSVPPTESYRFNIVDIFDK